MKDNGDNAVIFFTSCLEGHGDVRKIKHSVDFQIFNISNIVFTPAPCGSQH